MTFGEAFENFFRVNNVFKTMNVDNIPRKPWGVKMQRPEILIDTPIYLCLTPAKYLFEIYYSCRTFRRHPFSLPVQVQTHRQPDGKLIAWGVKPQLTPLQFIIANEAVLRAPAFPQFILVIVTTTMWYRIIAKYTYKCWM